MQHKNAQSIGEAISQFLKENKLDRRFDETHLVSAWEAVLGKSVANYTKSLFIKNRVLYAQINSSVLRHELQMNRERILLRLNEYVGREVIIEIVFR
jgi:predicted nucleic acid-binding Zn ribbon protein